MMASSSSSTWRRTRVRCVALCFAFLLAFLLYVGNDKSTRTRDDSTGPFSWTTSRKFLTDDKKNEEREVVVAERIGDACSRDDIDVYQAATAPLPSGIPTYTVQIHNVCLSGCTISDIHMSCGWFSSARLINPRIFRRLAYDDCLVNNGDALAAGGSLSFQYANTFPYRLDITSVNCHQ